MQKVIEIKSSIFKLTAGFLFAPQTAETCPFCKSILLIALLSLSTKNIIFCSSATIKPDGCAKPAA